MNLYEFLRPMLVNTPIKILIKDGQEINLTYDFYTNEACQYLVQYATVIDGVLYIEVIR